MRTRLFLSVWLSASLAAVTVSAQTASHTGNIVHVDTGLCLVPKGNGIAVGPCDGSRNQRWFVVQGDFNYIEHVASSRRLNGVPPQLTQGAADPWTRRSLGGVGTVQSGAWCLAVRNGAVRAEQCNGDSAQRWAFR